MDKVMNRETLAKMGVVLLFIASFFLAVLTVKAIKEYRYVGYDPSSGRNTITVQGEGEAFAVPDIASFTFTVTEEAETVALAQEAATAKTEAALQVVKDAGVEEKDIRTVGYNVYPKYEQVNRTAPAIWCGGGYCPPQVDQVISGYEVSQTIEVKVRDTENAGAILSGVGAAEISNVSSLNFTIDDEDEIVNEARSKAIADAREEAGRLAYELGVKLGKVVQFTESGDYPYLVKARMSFDSAESAMGGAAPAAAPLPMGENKVTSVVQVTYEIR